MTQTEAGKTDVTELVINQPTAPERKRPGYYWPFALSLIVLGLDQLTKELVESNLGPPGSGRSIELAGGQVRIIYILNKGASFGFLNNGEASWIFTLLAVVVSLLIIGWYIRNGTRNRWLQLGMGLVLGGIVGNLADRVFQEGGVTDIITIPNISLFRVFNLADSGITVGVTIIIATIVIQGWLHSRRLKAGAYPVGAEAPDRSADNQLK